MGTQRFCFRRYKFEYSVKKIDLLTSLRIGKTTKNTTQQQGKSILFTEHSNLYHLKQNHHVNQFYTDSLSSCLSELERDCDVKMYAGMLMLS